MKYSEVKSIIQQLHAAGWEKVPKTPTYRKIWEFGDLRYAHTLYFDQIRFTPYPLYEILQEYDFKAEREIANYLKNNPTERFSTSDISRREAIQFLSKVKGVPMEVGYRLYNRDALFKRAVDHISELYHTIRTHPALQYERRKMEMRNMEIQTGFDIEERAKQVGLKLWGEEDDDESK